MRRLKGLGAGEDQLVDIYIKQVRSLLELAVPAWHGAISQADKMDIERVQKAAFHIILGNGYISYKCALKSLDLLSLDSRRDKHPKHKNWYKVNTMKVNTRQDKTEYCNVVAKKNRYKTSPISYLTSLLNQNK